MENTRQLKTYCWHGDQCYFVSTIERDSSSSMGGRYPETIAWEYTWEVVEGKDSRGKMVAMEGDCYDPFRQHMEVVKQLFETGTYISIRDRE